MAATESGQRTFDLSVVTPEGTAFEGEAQMLVVPGADGEIGVLARHAPLVAMLKAGKVVALEFIFTTCPHCQAASHLMSRFQNELGSRGFQAIDVAFNDNSDLLVGAFAKEQQTTFPVGANPSLTIG